MLSSPSSLILWFSPHLPSLLGFLCGSLLIILLGWGHSPNSSESLRISDELSSSLSTSPFPSPSHVMQCLIPELVQENEKKEQRMYGRLPTIEEAVRAPKRWMLASGDEEVSNKRMPISCVEPPFELKAEWRRGFQLSDVREEEFSLKPTRNNSNANRIWDVFPFNDELDLLEVRLEELFAVVDYFVLIEASVTQSGKPKPFYFKENVGRFERYLSKIVYIQDEGKSGNEDGTRNYLIPYLKKIPENDLIVLTDLDEIPRCFVYYRLMYLEKIPSDTYGLLKMDLFYYSYRWKKTNPDRLLQIHSQTVAKVFYRKYLNVRNPSEIAFLHHSSQHHWLIDHAGWHCSYCSFPDRIQRKINALAHVEYAHPPFNEISHIKDVITTGKDIFLRENEELGLQTTSDPDIPFLVVAQRKKFKYFYPDLAENQKTTILAF